MRAIFGVLGLLIVLAVVGVLAKKQLGISSAAPLRMQSPVVADQAVTLPATPTGATQVQSRQIKQTLEAVMQQPRPMPDD